MASIAIDDAVEACVALKLFAAADSFDRRSVTALLIRTDTALRMLDLSTVKQLLDNPELEIVPACVTLGLRHPTVIAHVCRALNYIFATHVAPTVSHAGAIVQMLSSVVADGTALLSHNTTSSNPNQSSSTAGRGSAIAAPTSNTTLSKANTLAEEDVTCAFETLFGAVHCTEGQVFVRHLLNAQHLETLLEALDVQPMPTIAKFYLLAIFCRLVQHEPMSGHGASLLLVRGAVDRFIRVARDATPNAHATLKGMAIRVLADIVKTARSAPQVLNLPRMVMTDAVGWIRSEWSEVLESAFLFFAAVFGRRDVAFPSESLAALIKDNGGFHVAMALAVGSSTMRVAASAAHALRAFLLWADPTVVPTLKLLESPEVCQALTAAIFAHERSSSAAASTQRSRSPPTAHQRRQHSNDDDDTLGRRITATEAALCIVLVAQNSQADAQRTVHRLAELPRCHKLLRAIRGIVAEAHLSLFEGWAMFLPVFGGTRSAAGNGSAPLQRSASEQSSMGISENATTEAQQKWSDASKVKELLQRTVESLMAYYDSTTQSAQVNDRADDEAAATAVATTMYDHAFQLVTAVAHDFCSSKQKGSAPAATHDNDHPQHRSTSLISASPSFKSGRSLGSRIEKEKNVWAPKGEIAKAKIGKRTWSADDVLRSDLFIFDILLDAPRLQDAFGEVIASCNSHFLLLNERLQTCPVSKLSRRCFLTDMYVNVMPAILSCLELLQDALINSPQSRGRLYELARKLQFSSIHCGNLRRLCTAVTME